MEDPYGLLVTISCRVTQSMILVFVAFVTWSFRADIASLFQYTSSVVCRPSAGEVRGSDKQEKLKRCVAGEFQQWRLKMHHFFNAGMLPLQTLFAIALVIRLHDATAQVLLGSGVMFFNYILCVLLHRGTIPASRRAFDVMFLFWALLYSGRLVVDAYAFTAVSTAYIKQILSTWRTALSIGYFDYRIVLLVNLLVSALDVTLKIIVIEVPRENWYWEAATEVVQCAFIVALAYVVHEAGRLLVSERVESRASAGGKRAVRAILNVLCDAVVHLGREGAILEECPQLGHLLMTGVGSTPIFEGKNSMKYVVDEDKPLMTDLMSRQESADAAALGSSGHAMVDSAGGEDTAADAGTDAIHVSLKDAMGTVFRVQLIHTRLRDFDEDGHLFGIRDLGDAAREVSRQTVAPQVDSVGLLSPAPESDAASSTSSGSSRLGHQNGRDLRYLSSLSLVLDVHDRTLPIVEANIKFHRHIAEQASGGEQRLALSSCLPSQRLRSFDDWLQDATNALMHGHSAPSYGGITLKPPGSISMSAKRAYADAAEGDTVRVCFEDVNLRLPRVQKRSKRSSQYYHLASRAASSSSSGGERIPIGRSDITNTLPPERLQTNSGCCVSALPARLML
eukprot:TRINITY_DN2755_c1_g2_i2.p1 TRINITY_DN2755_c1_g2~~TRINITY_DN2755_c1_g2_i2.p1  ORF type:complete len:635 (-),score=58.97 TRINITY_DN2755_c1_g2_i2:607-2469(-)